MSSATTSKGLPSVKSQTLLSPNLQLLVTGFGLFVGFLCGMMVAWMTFSPGLNLIQELRQNEKYDTDMIAALAKSQPAAYEASLKAMPPAARARIEQVVGKNSVPAQDESAPGDSKL